MKTLTALSVLFLSFNLSAQEEEDSRWQKELIAGYTINNFGESYNLIYGISTSKHLFYGGFRLQEHSPVNMFEPIDGNRYRYDDNGFPIGLIIGYQRKFNLNNSAITPFAYADLEYAYLNSQENVLHMDMNGNVTPRVMNYEARSFILPAVGFGFDAQVYKNFHLRQSFGGTALFDGKYASPHPLGFLQTFNGIGFSIRMGLLYKF